MEMSPLVHALTLFTVGTVSAGWMRNNAPRCRAEWTGALALAALVLPPLLGQWNAFIFGAEGLMEALTAGILLGILLQSVRLRAPWILFASLLLLLEELDYGQVLFGFSKPSWNILEETSTLNFHNTSLSLLWRAVPLGGIVVLSLPAVRQWPLTQHLRLPHFHATTWRGVIPLLIGTLAIGLVHGERMADESFEWAAVTLVMAMWLKQPTAAAAEKSNAESS